MSELLFLTANNVINRSTERGVPILLHKQNNTITSLPTSEQQGE